MRMLIDKETAHDFLEVGKGILYDLFVYSEEEADQFEKHCVTSIYEEQADLILNASREFKLMMWMNSEARHVYTCNFSAIHMLRVLYKIYHFSENELYLFEELLSKYISKVVDMVEPPKNYERTNY